MAYCVEGFEVGCCPITNSWIEMCSSLLKIVAGWGGGSTQVLGSGGFMVAERSSA